LRSRFLREPVVTLTTILALAVGIGIATTGFTLLDSVLYSKLPFPNGDRFVLLEIFTEPGSRRAGLDPARFRFIAERASTLEHLGALRSTDVNLQLSSGEVVPVPGATVSPTSTSVTSDTPVLGRVLQVEDGFPNAPPVALIRESLWRRHFSASPRIIGTTAVMSGVARTIVGVMPDTFRFPGSGEVWLPFADGASTLSSARTFGVLRPGIDPAAADAEVAALSKQFEASDPGAPRLRILVLRFTDALSRGLELLSLALVACLVLVLVVIAANIANLVLARTVARSRELAVRAALGATRVRLVMDVFKEVLALGIIAAVMGLTASQALLAWLKETMTDMPFWVDFTASPRTMAFVACVTLLAAFVGGVMPALKATRRDTAQLLAETTRGATIGLGAAGNAMVAFQVALSIALLNAALVMARGVAGYMSPPVPVPPGEVLTARVWSETVPAAPIADAVAAMAGVRAAGASTSLPGLSPPAVMTEIQPLPGEPEITVRPAPVVGVRGAFFDAFDAKAEAGRLFVPGDFTDGAPPVAIVNQPFVSKFFGGTSPIGRRLRVVASDASAGPQPWREIVGVVPDLGLSAGDPSMAAGFYVPMDRDAVYHIVLRTSGDARRLASDLRLAISRVDPSIQIREIIPLNDVGREDRVVFAVIGAALAALGGMALLLSVIGTYAILSLSVTQRTREIGIRCALGASRGQVLRSIVGWTSLPPALGALAGLVLGNALVAARGIFAFRLPDSTGPWGLPILAAIMIAAGLLSAWIPARRALAVEPADALRAE
jgi:putative ABC transport system permease protein